MVWVIAGTRTIPVAWGGYWCGCFGGREINKVVVTSHELAWGQTLAADVSLVQIHSVISVSCWCSLWRLPGYAALLAELFYTMAVLSYTNRHPQVPEALPAAMLSTWSDGRCGSGLDFEPPRLYSQLGLASYSRFLQHKSQNTSVGNQKPENKDQGKTLTGDILAIVCALVGRDTYKLPWLHLVLCQLCQSIALDSNADPLLNSITIIA